MNVSRAKSWASAACVVLFATASGAQVLHFEFFSPVHLMKSAPAGDDSYCLLCGSPAAAAPVQQAFVGPLLTLGSVADDATSVVDPRADRGVQHVRAPPHIS